MRKAMRSLVLVLVSATSAQAADLVRTVPSGKNQRIDFFASVNPDCSTIGLPTVRLVDGPSDGVITTDKAKDFMSFPRSNVRFKCNGRRVAGLKALLSIDGRVLRRRPRAVARHLRFGRRTRGDLRHPGQVNRLRVCGSAAACHTAADAPGRGGDPIVRDTGEARVTLPASASREARPHAPNPPRKASRQPPMAAMGVAALLHHQGRQAQRPHSCPDAGEVGCVELQDADRVVAVGVVAERHHEDVGPRRRARAPRPPPPPPASRPRRRRAAAAG